jgi:predicted RNA-binding Zn ribbon-like protein
MSATASSKSCLGGSVRDVYASVTELELVGGHPALDLVNTVEPRVPEATSRPHDHLADPGALLIWARRAGLVDAGEAELAERAWAAQPPAGEQALSATREVREALHAVLLAAIAAAPGDDPAVLAGLDQLQLRWAAAAGRSTLSIRPGSPGIGRLIVGAAPATLVADRAADAAVDLIRTADPGRLRRCPADQGGCGWMFLDRSRNGSRRWCQMADCGTQAKVRRLTERRRAARHPGSSDSG